MIFFFFKQKTAYELRISDWSSDVCSSDLNLSPQVGRRGPVHGAAVTHPERPGLRLVRPQGRDHALQHGCHGRLACARRVHHIQVQAQQDQRRGRGRVAAFRQGRSEEQTSELQSLMRISYAVVCLKKKKPNTTQTYKLMLQA